PMHHLVCLPCEDSAELAEARRRELDLSGDRAIQLGVTAVEICAARQYVNRAGAVIDLRASLEKTMARVVSIRPGTTLPPSRRGRVPETRVLVCNQTTLGAMRRMRARGLRPLALNFANGLEPGGGFLVGARAQEEFLCRSSGLWVTLNGDAMYAAHRERATLDSTDWAILSLDVPVFRDDAGELLDEPWPFHCLTCAAPYAPAVGQPLAGDLLQARMQRVLAIAKSFQFDSLVLGAWGCGAFGHDPHRTARDFRSALETDFAGVFDEVQFAITDWSPERRFLGPFRDVFTNSSPAQGPR
ncbi:MAG: TIGR02452 family protein, partial [Planctomycetaceae bacterium]